MANYHLNSLFSSIHNVCVMCFTKMWTALIVLHTCKKCILWETKQHQSLRLSATPVCTYADRALWIYSEVEQRGLCTHTHTQHIERWLPIKSIVVTFNCEFITVTLYCFLLRFLKIDTTFLIACVYVTKYLHLMVLKVLKL